MISCSIWELKCWHFVWKACLNFVWVVFWGFILIDDIMSNSCWIILSSVYLTSSECRSLPLTTISSRVDLILTGYHDLYSYYTYIFCAGSEAGVTAFIQVSRSTMDTSWWVARLNQFAAYRVPFLLFSYAYYFIQMDIVFRWFLILLLDACDNCDIRILRCVGSCGCV